jgi:hypothetical protein
MLWMIQTPLSKIHLRNTHSLLAELLGTLILGVLDQLHDATLIGSEASDFANKITDELGALALDLMGKKLNVSLLIGITEVK